MESDTLPLQNDTFTIMKIISMFLINRDYRCLYLRDLFPFFFGINLLIAELYLESFSLVLWAKLILPALLKHKKVWQKEPAQWCKKKKNPNQQSKKNKPKKPTEYL